ncbi:lantibiotic dehydratase family protein [Actinoplanes sp. NBC_00393]|uniref:lantibiotic dehydratase n=1 Tax=Actinoplanes sp. NBC_00393 TaxID=2975953 RepID=UPI002E1D6725
MPIAHHRYRPAGPVLVRASTLPGWPDELSLPDPTGSAAESLSWLAGAWAYPGLAEAVGFANASLAARIDGLLDAGDAAPPKDVRRIVTTLWSYLVRWQRRVTPFGLFAGVSTATVGPATGRFGPQHRVVLRADADWLARIVDLLEQDRELRSRLLVIADNSTVVRGQRIFVACRPQPGQTAPGPVRETSTRRTRIVQAALAAARRPVPFGNLVTQLSGELRVDGGKVEALLHSLIDGGFLITNLRSPMTALDGLAHLLTVLDGSDAGDLPEVAELAAQLDGVQALLTRHNASPGPVAAADLRCVAGEVMARVVPGVQPLAADVHLDADIQLPEPVLQEATRAAELLLRLSTKPFGSQAWVDYQVRFRNRFGPGALVPVLDLVADSGLGYPAGYLGAPKSRPTWRTVTERDVHLARLIQQVVLAGADEIVLSTTDIEALTVGDFSSTAAPTRIELGVTVHATSTQALDEGDFELWVTGAPRHPTSMIGRFAYLLEPAEQARIAATYTAVSSGDESLLPVQVSFPPRRVHNQNVVRVGRLLPTAVSVAEQPDGEVISLDDLAVTADAEQLYLVRILTGQRIAPHIPHALDVTVQTPPLARFLAEVADARNAVFSPFDLGTARTLPYIPRIRHGRTVVSPARWLIAANDLDPRPARESDRWEKAVDGWRHRWRVPSRVIVCDGELRLPLDLDQAADRALFRTRLRRAELLEVREDGPVGGSGWLGRPAEFVIPMLLITPASRRLPHTAAPGVTLRPGDSTVVHAQLAGNPACFDLLLTTYLPLFAAELDDLVVRWWIRWHRDLARPDADQHLAMFLRLRDAAGYAEVATRLARFAADLHTRRLPGELTLASYHEHPGRFGNNAAAAERVFAADTQAATAQLRMAERTAIPAQALAAASMARLAADFGPDPATGYQQLLRSVDRHSEPIDRKLGDLARGLTDPSDDYLHLRTQAGGDEVVNAWKSRGTALREYHGLLLPHRDPAGVLRTLLHEHHMRAVGIDPDVERRTGQLARAAVMRALAAVGRR